MGVTGLWTVVAPTARPTQLATLNRKRLAVDASIWIYQFLKAVRDKEGNALRNSHVVGFFRRICKLLYFGIKPVFVFDGGAPILKRETVRSRARRREGRREDAARTAGKLLAVQVARAAEEEEKRRRSDRVKTPIEDELPADQELVYVDEIGMSQKERQAGRGFKRKDQYHLPDLDISIESMGAPNDPRIMSQGELEEYARQFHRGEDINLYDFSKIDFESPFFLSLPPGDRYNILNAARLRSRLRMGYSKDQLDGMFPDRMAFSRFQIERVKERNELTQRLMHVNGMAEDFLNQGGRIAGEKGKEYVLVKNDGVEGGWALGVVSNKLGTKEEDAINLDDDDGSISEAGPSEEDEDFEDVAIEGLNRLPKVWHRKRREEVDYDTKYGNAVEEIARKRKAVYEARTQKTDKQTSKGLNESVAFQDDANALFVPENDHATDRNDDDTDDLFEDVDIGQSPQEEEDDELQRAIAMSLRRPDAGLDPKSGGFLQEPNDADAEMDLQAALAESRQSKYKSKTNIREKSPPLETSTPTTFDGPLPFESLNLGQSLLGKKKSKKVEEDLSGGFDRSLGDDAFRRERPPQPMPSWFDTAPAINDTRPEREHDAADDSDDHVTYGREDVDRRETLQRHMTNEVIDLEDERPKDEAIPLDDPDLEDAGSFAEDASLGENTMDEKTVLAEEAERTRKQKEDDDRNHRYRIAQEIADDNVDEGNVVMDNIADHTRTEPPVPSHVPKFAPAVMASQVRSQGHSEDEEIIDWSESEAESDSPQAAASRLSIEEVPAGGPLITVPTAEHRTLGRAYSDDEDDDTFEDVPPPSNPAPRHMLRQQSTLDNSDMDLTSQYLIADPEAEAADQNGGRGATADPATEDQEYMSDSDEELMRQLAIEADEHARFASSLNNTKTPLEVARDYENELKQLRNQQKKDRRDADEVTQVMVQECQALLRLFGLPYITAPMEAEAQCAELVHLGLVDGIVTDDSDIFLFGGTRVYKNMFNAAKFVECYLTTDLEKEYALDRKKLIRFAHLLGSDYTEGIPGVGPVTALEILTEFPTLQEFKEWCSKVQLGRPKDLEDQLTTPFRRKFRNTVQKRLFLPPGFPDVRVDQAYLQPDVDSDPQEFQWGVPDLDKLRSFLMATIGWNQERTDEILVPVVKDMNKREVEGTQANITRFFAGGVGIGASGKEGNAPRNRTGRESGRMANAFRRLRGEAEKKRKGDDDDVDGIGNDAADIEAEAATEIPDADDVGDESAIRRPKPKKGVGGIRKSKRAADEAEGDLGESGDGEDESDFSTAKVSKRKKRRKQRATMADE